MNCVNLPKAPYRRWWFIHAVKVPSGVSLLYGASSPLIAHTKPTYLINVYGVRVERRSQADLGVFNTIWFKSHRQDKAGLNYLFLDHKHLIEHRISHTIVNRFKQVLK